MPAIYIELPDEDDAYDRARQRELDDEVERLREEQKQHHNQPKDDTRKEQ